MYTKETNTVLINVVNGYKDKTIAADIISNSGVFTGKAETKLLTSDSIDEPFTFDRREQYTPVTKEITVKGNTISYSFPAHSFVQIEVKIKK